MTDISSTSADTRARRGILVWATLLLSLFPLVALLTFDWRAIESLNAPAAPSTNWIGPLGDSFAYYGYATFGLAIWIVPVVCVLAAVGRVRGRQAASRWRFPWLLLFLVSSACLLQVFGGRIPALAGVVSRLNVQNAGG